MTAVKEMYGNKLRVRVTGIHIKNDSILLINHKGLTVSDEFWSPPGGGMKYGEDARTALKREWKEETNLNCEVGEFLFVNEFYDNPLHAIELFFKINSIEGELKKGYDPEHGNLEQIINETSYVTFNELAELPNNKKHNILNDNISAYKLLNLRGYFKLWQ